MLDEKNTKGTFDEKKQSNPVTDLTKKLYESIPSYKKKALQYELSKVKQEMYEENEEKKRKGNFMSVE